MEYIKEKYGSKLPNSMYEAMDHDGFIEFSIGDGWIPLVVELHNKLITINPDYKVVQVKEKFGGARIYCDYFREDLDIELNNEMEWLVRNTELKSYQICEECGKPGELRTNGWWKTLCDVHAEGRGR